MVNSKTIVSKLSIQTISVILQAVIQLITIMVMSRLLSKVDFGIFAIASGIRALALIISEAGVGAAIVQSPKISKSFVATAFWTTFISGFFFTAVVFIFSGAIANFNNEEAVKNVLKCVSVTFVFYGLSSIPRSLLLRELKLFHLMCADVIPLLINHLLIGIYLAFKGYGVWAMVWALVGTSFFKMVILFILSKYKVTFVFSKEAFRKLIRFGAGLTSASILNNISANIDKLLLGGILSVSLLGSFNRVMEMVIMLSRYPASILDMVFFPTVSRLQHDHEKVYSLYALLMDGILILVTVMYIYMIFFSKEIILFVLGSKWLFMSNILKVISLLLIFNLIAAMSSMFLRSIGFVYHITFVRIVACLVSLTGVLIGSRWSLEGVAYGVTISNFIISTTMVFVVCRSLKKPPSFLLKSIVRAGVIGSVFYVIQITTSLFIGYIDIGNIWISALLRLVISLFLLVSFYAIYPRIFGILVSKVMSLFTEKYFGREHFVYKRFILFN